MFLYLPFGHLDIFPAILIYTEDVLLGKLSRSESSIPYPVLLRILALNHIFMKTTSKNNIITIDKYCIYIYVYIYYNIQYFSMIKAFLKCSEPMQFLKKIISKFEVTAISKSSPLLWILGYMVSLDSKKSFVSIQTWPAWTAMINGRADSPESASKPALTTCNDFQAKNVW